MKTIFKNFYFSKIQDNNLLLSDHLGGFDKNLESDTLNSAVQFSKENNISTIKSGYVFFGYFNKDYCSKNFTHNGNEIDGHIANYVENTEFYNKFFDCTDEFNQQINSFGHMRFDHAKNIYNLENKLTQSFLHIVSETMAISYYPFVTEKSLYSIITRGLFLAYAQLGWNAHIEKYFGFKLYTKLFDYRFDSITNPVERLIELMTMIGKFSKLTTDEWHDLYLLESDSIEYNYDHYFSKNYLKSLK